MGIYERESNEGDVSKRRGKRKIAKGPAKRVFMCGVCVSQGAPGFEPETGVRKHQSNNTPKCPPMGRTPGHFTEPVLGALNCTSLGE
jgi:hypothetical protein